jgi:hypothetical protein
MIRQSRKQRGRDTEARHRSSTSPHSPSVGPCMSSERCSSGDHIIGPVAAPLRAQYVCDSLGVGQSPGGHDDDCVHRLARRGAARANVQRREKPKTNRDPRTSDTKDEGCEERGMRDCVCCMKWGDVTWRHDNEIRCHQSVGCSTRMFPEDNVTVRRHRTRWNPLYSVLSVYSTSEQIRRRMSCS